METDNKIRRPLTLCAVLQVLSGGLVLKTAANLVPHRAAPRGGLGRTGRQGPGGGQGWASALPRWVRVWGASDVSTLETAGSPGSRCTLPSLLLTESISWEAGCGPSPAGPDTGSQTLESPECAAGGGVGVGALRGKGTSFWMVKWRKYEVHLTEIPSEGVCRENAWKTYCQRE